MSSEDTSTVCLRPVPARKTNVALPRSSMPNSLDVVRKPVARTADCDHDLSADSRQAAAMVGRPEVDSCCQASTAAPDGATASCGSNVVASSVNPYNCCGADHASAPAARTETTSQLPPRPFCSFHAATASPRESMATSGSETKLPSGEAITGPDQTGLIAAADTLPPIQQQPTSSIAKARRTTASSQPKSPPARLSWPGSQSPFLRLRVDGFIRL